MAGVPRIPQATPPPLPDRPALPDLRIYGSHGKAEVTAWCAGNDIELVFTPSNGSWLNWVECEFTAIRYFTLNGSDYPSHQAQETAIARYIRWRNKHTQPKRHFAIGSKIRHPDYLPLSA